jgi:6-phosphogluconolactonase
MVEREVGGPAAIAARFLAELRSLAGAAAAERRPFSIALSGGSVATTLFPALVADRPLDWPGTAIFWADERAVRPDDPESNYGLARKLWLAPARVPETSIHRMPADLPDLGQAASQYAEEITHVLGSSVIDLVLLGIGPDGHVASLFPGHPLLAERAVRVAAITDSPKPPPRRLTMTVPTLTSARLVVIGAFGAAKAPNVADAIANPASRLPAGLVSRTAARTLWLLDEAAAQGLPK